MALGMEGYLNHYLSCAQDSCTTHKQQHFKRSPIPRSLFLDCRLRYSRSASTVPYSHLGTLGRSVLDFRLILRDLVAWISVFYTNQSFDCARKNFESPPTSVWKPSCLHPRRAGEQQTSTQPMILQVIRSDFSWDMSGCAACA